MSESEVQAVLYRLGRSMKRESAALNQLLRSSSGGRGSTQYLRDDRGVDLHELLQVCQRYSLPISQAEVILVVCRYENDGFVAVEVFEEALRVASEAPPPEVAWAMQTFASIGVAARSEGQSLAAQLMSLGEGANDSTADPRHLQDVLATHTQMAEEQWDALLTALDKQSDGRVLLEPLVQWAAGMGVS